MSTITTHEEFWSEINAACQNYKIAEAEKREADRKYSELPSPCDLDKASWQGANLRFLDARARLHHARRDCDLAGISEYPPGPEVED